MDSIRFCSYKLPSGANRKDFMWTLLAYDVIKSPHMVLIILHVECHSTDLTTTPRLLRMCNSAWRPLRRVDAELDPGGRGKELVGECLNTLRARLATVS